MGGDRVWGLWNCDLISPHVEHWIITDFGFAIEITKLWTLTKRNILIMPRWQRDSWISPTVKRETDPLKSREKVPTIQFSHPERCTTSQWESDSLVFQLDYFYILTFTFGFLSMIHHFYFWLVPYLNRFPVSKYFHIFESISIFFNRRILSRWDHCLRKNAAGLPLWFRKAAIAMFDVTGTTTMIVPRLIVTDTMYSNACLRLSVDFVRVDWF